MTKAVKKVKSEGHIPTPDPEKIVPTCITCGEFLVGVGNKEQPWRHKNA